MSQHKRERLESQIASIVNNTILMTIENPIVKEGVVTYVKLSADLGVAKLYLDCLNRKKVEQVKAAFITAKGVFKTALSKRLNIRKVPELIFVVDEAIDEAIKIDAILNEIKAKKDKE